MSILVLNCGSSSLKYQLINISSGMCLTKGSVEKIGGNEAIFSYEIGKNERFKEVYQIFDHTDALTYVIKSITNPDHNILKSIDGIAAIGHRVVHGGEKFTESVLIDDGVISEIRECMELAPLHNPANLQGILVCMKLLPDVPNIAVFDTAFHQTMPDYAYIYALPYVMYTRHKIRRYGFHGTSHRFVAERAAKMLGKPLKNTSVITCHLGNGSSICAIKNGKSIDTSMGFTPLEGLIMGSRSGDLDPAIILHIISKEELTVHEANSMLNKHSGLLGISGNTNDMRELTESMKKGDKRAQLAISILVYRLKKYICGYLGAMGGADAIIFTAGIGENSAYVRENSLSNLEFMGIKIDKRKNKSITGEGFISGNDSKIKILVISTNEELVIARDTANMLKKRKK
ncbi:MAG: acetate kinase [Spirochaetes bacterium]|nr:acetate kinase [Spirochaetota bacterium]